MNIEQHCITLEQALKINNLIRGDRDSLFCYCRPIDRNPNIVHEPLLVYRDDKSIPDNTEVVCSAYTASELGEILTSFEYEAFGHEMMFTVYYHNNVYKESFYWSCMFRNPITFKNPEIKAPTEVQARAQLLIHLLENKIITL